MILLVFFAIGNVIFVLFQDRIIVCQELFLFSLLVIVDVSVYIEATEENLKKDVKI